METAMAAATRIEFHPLTFVDERDGVTVGRPDIDSYVELPADGAALLRRLCDGLSPVAAAEWYETTYGEPVDVTGFVDSLRELGFVRADGEPPATAPVVRWQALGRAAFSLPAGFCYAVIIIGCLVVTVAYEPVRPHAANVFFHPSLVVVQVLLAAVQLPAVLWHEWFHVLAARRLGLPSRLSVGRRLYYFVVETQLNGLHSVPRGKRYLPVLAGMFADVLLYCVLVLTVAADLPGGLSLAGKLALGLAYTVLLRLAWQFYVFLRTDLYYVLTTALGCTNLHEATSAYLRKRFAWLPGHWKSTLDDDEDWSPRDRQLAPAFALISVVGIGFLLVTLVFGIVPMLVEFVTRVWSPFTVDGAGAARFADSAVSLLIVSLEFVVLPLFAGRRKRTTSTPTF
jgi:hypothetical protein